MITLPLPAVDAPRSGWLFSSTALADGGFNYLLVFALSSLAAGAIPAALF